MAVFKQLGNALLTTAVIVCFTFMVAVIVAGVIFPDGALVQWSTPHRVAAPAQR